MARTRPLGWMTRNWRSNGRPSARMCWISAITGRSSGWVTFSKVAKVAAACCSSGLLSGEGRPSSLKVFDDRLIRPVARSTCHKP